MGPHPYFPFLAFGRELVVLIDRKTGFELIGHDAGEDANFSHAVVTDIAGARAFAKKSEPVGGETLAPARQLPQRRRGARRPLPAGCSAGRQTRATDHSTGIAAN